MPSRRPGVSRETYREEAGVEVEQRHEHQHQQDAAPELHVLPGGALAHGGHAREHALALGAGLSQQQQQAASQGQVPAGHTPRRSLRAPRPRPCWAGRVGGPSRKGTPLTSAPRTLSPHETWGSHLCSRGSGMGRKRPHQRPLQSLSSTVLTQRNSLHPVATDFRDRRTYTSHQPGDTYLIKNFKSHKML